MFQFFHKLRARQILLPILIIASMGMLFLIHSSHTFLAGILPPQWDSSLEQVEEFVSPPQEGNAVDKIKVLFWKNFVPLFKYLMIAVSILFYIAALTKIVTSSGNEEEIKNARMSMLWGVLGFIIIALAIDIAEGFDPVSNQGKFVNTDMTESAVSRLVTYFQLLGGIIATFYIFFSGFRLITAHGDDEIITAQKNHIKWGFSGLIFIMLADPMVNKVFYPSNGQRGLGEEELRVFFAEGSGAIKFFLTFTGILAVISIVVAGILYLTAMGDDSRTETAKKIILGSAVALIIILMSFVIVSTFIAPA